MRSRLLPSDDHLHAAPRVKRVVVALDGSPETERSLDHARRLADLVGLAVELVVVVDHEANEGRALDYLRSLRASGPGEVHRTVVDADPAVGLVTAFGSEPGVLGCTATHARDRSAVFLGSVSEDVLDDLHHPLLLVGPEARARAGPVGPVVAAIAGHEADDGVAATATTWAHRLETRLVLMTVIEPTQDPVVPWHLPDRAHGPAVPDEYLAQLAQTCRAAGVQVTTSVLRDPADVAEPLVDALGAMGPELVVVGRRHHTPARRLALGDRQTRIVRHSPAPVLVVPVERAR